MLRTDSSDISVARRRFFDDGAAPHGMVPATILASWQRCLRLGLVAQRRPQAEPLPGSALKEIKARHERLRRLCRPELDALFASAHDAGGIALLTAPDGVILEARGHPTFLDRASSVALRPGAPWSEDATGTNAIGTALVERREVEVRGGEHYFAPHRMLGCSASPIFDPQGAVAGVLDLSGESSLHHPHALGMVRLAVEQIEHRLFERDCAGREVLRLQRDPALFGTAREGLLVIEGDRLVAANRHALRLLGLDWSDLGHRRSDETFSTALPPDGRPATVRSHAGEALHVRRDAPGKRVSVAVREPPRRAPPAPRTAAPVFDAALDAELTRHARLLDADIPVVILGETGTGKEVAARELHRRSARARRPFVAVNCAALPESLIESELFGYAPGAYTGARREGAPGLLREAEGGVLFLDEIGDMPLGLQTRLLRVLQEREVTPLGGGGAVALDVAVIAATHCQLEQAVEAGRFRADLYYRIAHATLALPPLRERPGRRELVRALWAALAPARHGVALEDELVEHLAALPWPGNLRQLAGTLRTLLALSEPGARLDVSALPPALRRAPPPASAPTEAAGTLDAVERAAMRDALDACAGNVSAAARRLGVSRSTLYRRLGARD